MNNILKLLKSPKTDFLFSWKVFLHVFTDGEDNASDALRKKELDDQVKFIQAGESLLQHSFIYSFNTRPDFQAVRIFFSLFVSFNGE